jgi:hypothetical protein
LLNGREIDHRLESVFAEKRYSACVRPLNDLVAADPAWPILSSRIASAACAVEVLDREVRDGEAALLALQVTTRSFLGTIAYETGGLLLDQWLRVLGAGNARLRSIQAWNQLGGDRRFEGGLLVGDDAVGGFFAWMSSRTIAYFAPDTLAWEDLGIGYEAWVERMLVDLDRFYADVRWSGWREEVAELSPDSTLQFYPPLFTRECRPLEACTRRAVPIAETWSLEMAMPQQLI